MEKVVLCDRDVIIELFKGNEDVVFQLRQIGEGFIAINSITVGELIYGALNKGELRQILLDLDNLRLLTLNAEIGRIKIDLLTRYSLSHNLTLPDALIAATALHYRVPLYTLNEKDFRYIEDLNLYRPQSIDK